MQSTSLPAGQITGQVLMYSNPQPLSLEQHGDMGLISSDRPFAFAFGANAVPVQVTEFGLAALSYPIIFAGEERTPLAVMSVRENENLFITDGRFDVEAYIPAFIRRYPFVTATSPGDDNMIVCIDADAGFLTKDGGDVKLFENGEPSDYTKNAIEFCKNFELERQRTANFVQLLKDLDLLEERKQTITPTEPDGTAGEPVQLSDYFAVSQDRLNALDPAKLAELRDSGALVQIYAHILSLALWERLVMKTLQRFPQETAGNA